MEDTLACGRSRHGGHRPPRSPPAALRHPARGPGGARLRRARPARPGRAQLRVGWPRPRSTPPAGCSAGRSSWCWSTPGAARPRSAREAAGWCAPGPFRRVVGTHASDVRVALERSLGGRVPYVYTPPYEGGAPQAGVYLLGETRVPAGRPRSGLADRPPAGPALGPARQRLRLAAPAAPPRPARTSGRARRSWSAERFVPSGTTSMTPLIEELAAVRPDAVLLKLIGSDLVAFNRAFAASGLGWCSAVRGAGGERPAGAGGDTERRALRRHGLFRQRRHRRQPRPSSSDTPAGTGRPRRCSTATGGLLRGRDDCWPPWPGARARRPCARSRRSPTARRHGGRGSLTLSSGHVRPAGVRRAGGRARLRRGHLRVAGSRRPL